MRQRTGPLTGKAVPDGRGWIAVCQEDVSSELPSKHLMMSSLLLLSADGSLSLSTNHFRLMLMGASDGRRILMQSAYI